MTLKETINQVYYLNKKKTKLLELINYYEVMSNSIPGQDFSKERVDCTPSQEAPYLKWIYKKIDAEQELKELDNKIKHVKEELFVLFENLNDVYYKFVLSYRYIELLTWQEIADKINFSLPSVYRFHRLAISELEAIKT